MQVKTMAAQKGKKVLNPSSEDGIITEAMKRKNPIREHPSKHVTKKKKHVSERSCDLLEEALVSSDIIAPERYCQCSSSGENNSASGENEKGNRVAEEGQDRQPLSSLLSANGSCNLVVSCLYEILKYDI